MQKTINLLLGSGLLLISLLWLSSYTHHSAIGIDHDTEQEHRILHTFYRINWNGHGSVLIGYGSVWKAIDKSKSLEKFDPASVVLKPVSQPLASGSIWNKMGFWYINSSSSRPTWWLGIPSWLPVLCLTLLIRLRLSRR